MNTVSSDMANALFSAVQPQQAQFDGLANSALTRGIDLYQQGNYDGAVKEFRRSIGLSPYSQYTPQAYDYLVQALLKQKKTNDAVAAYQQAIRLDPGNDAYHLSLGNLYYSQNRNREALAEYQQAVRLDPTSTTNRFSLGEAYLNSGNYQGALEAFKAVEAMTPGDPNVSFVLGQTYRQMGRYRDAVDQLQETIGKKSNFGSAYYELGLTYLGAGDFDKAKEQVAALSSIDAALSVDLQGQINKQEQPKMAAVYATDGFTMYAGPRTAVSSLDSSLATPGASREFTLHVIFDKSMDVASVTNPVNWSIGRAAANLQFGAYNWGLPIPSTEVSIAPIPNGIVYDQDSLTADVKFTIRQNASGDGTIDPSHILFRFYGKDAFGNTMSTSADEYSGISKIV